MNEPLLIFQSFQDRALAEEIAEKLNQHEIPFAFDDTSSPIDPLIIGSDLNADIRIKLRQQDFPRAHQVLHDYYQEQLATVQQDYYLFSFTSEELMDTIQKPYEWGQLDYLLAQKILKDRGIEVSVEQLERSKAESLEEMARPEAVSSSWIILGYLLSVCFSLIGLFYGGVLLSFKKSLPDGRRVYSYSAKDRRHGRNMLLISSFLFIFWLLTKLLMPKQSAFWIPL
jgi:hypothetical protein